VLQAIVVDRNVTHVLWPRTFSMSRLVLEEIRQNEGEATAFLHTYSFITS
jgi:hypothetical protein